MDRLEVIGVCDLVALKLRCASDCIARAFDALGNDALQSPDVIYIQRQVQQGIDYLESARGVISKLAGDTVDEVVAAMHKKVFPLGPNLAESVRPG